MFHYRKNVTITKYTGRKYLYTNSADHIVCLVVYKGNIINSNIQVEVFVHKFSGIIVCLI